MDYRKLKSGNDIRGTAMGTNAVITVEFAEKLGSVFAYWLKTLENKDPVLACGHDSRLTSEALSKAFCRGAVKQGAQVLDFGLCTTPAVCQSVQRGKLPLSGAVMVTASHHPPDKNGFKLFTKHYGEISGVVLKEIFLLLNQPLTPSDKEGSVVNYNYLENYCQSLAELTRKLIKTDDLCPLLGLNVVIDASNGTGGFYAKLLEDLGADTTGSLFLEPDGHFPNHIPNPEDTEALQMVSKAVIENEADIGIIFDADCDRVAVVDSDGKAVNRNRLIALTAAILLDKTPGITIVTDSVTSSGLTKFIGEWGGVHYRYKRGYRNVIDEAIRLNKSGVDCPLAIETSGHAAFRENDFTNDGMYLATLLVCQTLHGKRNRKKLTEPLESLDEPVECNEKRFPITADDFRAKGLELIDRVMDDATEETDRFLAPDNREGVRINFNLEEELSNAWMLLRLSVHDPVVVLNMESDVEGGIAYMENHLRNLIIDMTGIDFSTL